MTNNKPCLFPNCTPDTCSCAGTPDDIEESLNRRRQAKQQELLKRLREELIDAPERQYKQHGKPFGEDGLDTWLGFGGGSGGN